MLANRESVKPDSSKRQECVEGRAYKLKLVSPEKQGPKCKEKVIEFLCSCCLLCVCCPVAAVCCIKLPCKFCQQALRRAWQWACNGSKNRSFAEYSSFSDIDSDVAFGKVRSCVSKD